MYTVYPFLETLLSYKQQDKHITRKDKYTKHLLEITIGKEISFLYFCKEHASDKESKTIPKSAYDPSFTLVAFQKCLNAGVCSYRMKSK